MTIRELQKKIADALNGVEALVQGGCKAFPEELQKGHKINLMTTSKRM